MVQLCLWTYMYTQFEKLRLKFFEGKCFDKSLLTKWCGRSNVVPTMCCAWVQIAVHADFFSFGTNDLTQMTFGYSRDDVSKFLPSYLSRGILQHDPFEVITNCSSCLGISFSCHSCDKQGSQTSSGAFRRHHKENLSHYSFMGISSYGYNDHTKASPWIIGRPFNDYCDRKETSL